MTIVLALATSTSRKPRHKVNKCPERTNKVDDDSNEDSGRTEKFKGRCNICGRSGHKAADCWEEDRNKEKRPEWFKTISERAMLAAGQPKDGDETEYVLTTTNGMEFRASAELLRDPNVFIGDTGASSDTTMSEIGFKNSSKGRSMI